MSFTVRRLKESASSTKKQSKKVAAAARSVSSALGWAAKLSGPLLMIGHLWNERRQEEKKHEARVNLLKRITVILVAVFLSFLLFAGTTRALVALKVISLQNIATIAGSDLPSDQYGHTNVLLLGQGDAGHDGIDLTDTIMIASLDPGETKSAALFSLPRDLYFLETANMGEGRINSLYRDYKIVLERSGKTTQEASQLAMRELANEIGLALGMEIHHIVKVDFIGFVQAVDAIGGVDIVVPEDLIDTEYPGPNYTYETFAINAGPQNLDGETALKYARSRHSTSDFDRSARQQQILRAIADKMKTEGTLTKPGQIMDLLSILEEHVETTLQTRDMVSMAALGKELDQSRIITMQLNTENGLYGAFSAPGGLLYTPPRDQFNGAAVLLPVSIPEFPVTWKQIRLLVQLMVHERTAHIEKTPISVLNTGAEPGSARRLGGELIRFGFNVVATENAPDRRERPDTVIIASGTGSAGALLHELLGYPMESQQMPQVGTPATGSSESFESSDSSPSSVITIELGEDFVYRPLQDSLSDSTPSQP